MITMITNKQEENRNKKHTFLDVFQNIEQKKTERRIIGENRFFKKFT